MASSRDLVINRVGLYRGPISDKATGMSHIPPSVGSDLSYLVLAVVFFWIAFGVRTFLHYRGKWALEKDRVVDGTQGPHNESAQASPKASPDGSPDTARTDPTHPDVPETGDGI